MAQLFLYPPSLSRYRPLHGQRVETRERHAYIIRNSGFGRMAATERRTMSILGRSINSMLQMQGIGDNLPGLRTTQKDGVISTSLHRYGFP